MKCRPEIAPGLSLMDSSQALAQQAARLIEQAAHDGRELSMPQLAAFGWRVVRLPSTSPANASWSFDRKLAAWRAAFVDAGVA